MRYFASQTHCTAKAVSRRNGNLDMAGTTMKRALAAALAAHRARHRRARVRAGENRAAASPRPRCRRLHVKMLYVFRDELNKAAPGRFDVQVHHSGTFFLQGAEAVAMQRGNLEMALLSMQDIARQIPEYSIFTAAT